jgi:putative IMPACT (imprinted ancient) family translation regulator
MIVDIFKTIKSASEETLFKDKNSKFYGYVFPVNNKDQVKNELEESKKDTSKCRSSLLCVSNWS